MGIDTVFLAGVTAASCVRATAVDAFFLGYDVQIIKSAVAASTPAQLKTSLAEISQHYAVIIHHRDLEQILFDPTLPTVYYVNGSIPSWRVQLLAEKRVAYNPRRVHVMSTPKETWTPQFVEINTRCKTPVLVESDGTKIIESQAILQYLDVYYPPSFTPMTTDKEAYRLCLQRFHESENLHNACEGLEYGFLDPSDIDSAKETAMIDSLGATMEELGFWETYTRQTDYVAGNDFTIADCSFYPVIQYLVHRGLKLDGEEWHSLRAYVERVSARNGEIEAAPVGWKKTGKVDLFAKASRLKGV
ncbi:glutathione s-transferase [Moniliophthora roreri MCA 2997]|uniref:Glutathione s-transferase n=1 Tax=Moniliophthora roreri (strain MCA 2997) TaxID=1381753 RepID=V2X442_MONRO|nr:glutathione s-transferase [Moniliophthora roreri MCA 2997]